MHAAAAAAQFDRMAQVKHLVIHEIFDGITRRLRTVEYTAHDDGVVGGIVVAQAVARVIAAPGHLRTRHQSMKEARIQIIEDLFQVVMLAVGAEQALAPAHLPDQVGLGRDALAAGKFTEARSMLLINFFAIKLGDQDVKDGVQDWIGRTFKKIRDSHQNPSLAQPNGVVQIGEREEQNLELRHGIARTEFAVGAFEEGTDCWIHVFSD